MFFRCNPDEPICHCQAYTEPHPKGLGNCYQEIDRGECVTCGGSGGGDGYWRCQDCGGSGLRRPPRFESDEPSEPVEDPDAWQDAQNDWERGMGLRSNPGDLSHEQHLLQAAIQRATGRRYQIDVSVLDPESVREFLRLLRDQEYDKNALKNRNRRGPWMP